MTTTTQFVFVELRNAETPVYTLPMLTGNAALNSNGVGLSKIYSLRGWKSLEEINLMFIVWAADEQSAALFSAEVGEG